MRRLLQNKKLRVMFMVVKALTTLLVCLIVSVIFIQRVSNNKITLGGYSIYTIVSESMLPKYEIGDMIVSKKVEVSNIKLYDDVVYMGMTGDFKDRIVTHQVIDIEMKNGNYTFTTKGLANTGVDPDISGSQIYGVVVYKTFILSFLSKIVNNTYGFYFIVFIPFAIMVFLEILEVMKEKDALKNSGGDYE